MNIEQAKKMPIELVLKKSNFIASKIRGNDVWYRSPFRQENTSSFKVNTLINRWYDHGIQKGGNIIDLIQIQFNYTIPEVLNFLNEYSDEVIFSFQKQKSNELITIKSSSEINILTILEIQHFALLDYLEKRNIWSFDNVPNLKEVHYEINGKHYFGIGFLNNLNGFEIRSKYAKICIGKKSITHIKNEKTTLIVFEGFIDFLSFLNCSGKSKNTYYDYLILNSVALVNKCYSIFDSYKIIHLYLDNDPTGKNYTKQLLTKYSNAVDKSITYSDYKDLNDWLINTSHR